MPPRLLTGAFVVSSMYCCLCLGLPTAYPTLGLPLLPCSLPGPALRGLLSLSVLCLELLCLIGLAPRGFA